MLLCPKFPLISVLFEAHPRNLLGCPLQKIALTFAVGPGLVAFESNWSSGFGGMPLPGPWRTNLPF